jgi:hypothetical protein
MKKPIVITIIALAVLGLGVILFLYGGNNPTEPPTAQNDTVSNDLSHVPSGGQLLGNLQKAGLEALNAEGTVMHIHQHLDIIINNKAIAVPTNIGVGSGFISPIHSHDQTGIIHVESPVKKDFTLGQFFKEWNVGFDDNRIGTYSSDQTHKLVVAVNGNPITQVQNYILKAHDEIEVWYGDKNSTPSLVKEYSFPQGE